MGTVPPLPRYYAVLRLPAARPGALRCLRLPVPRLGSSFDPRPEEPVRRSMGLVSRPPTRLANAETTGSPRFLGVPHPHMLRSTTPVEARCQATAAPSCCLPRIRRRRLPHYGADGAPSRSLRGPCVRFAVAVTRPPRNTRFRLVANLYRTGFHTRWDAQRVSETIAATSLPPSPGFAWRNVSSP